MHRYVREAPNVPSDTDCASDSQSSNDPALGSRFFFFVSCASIGTNFSHDKLSRRTFAENALGAAAAAPPPSAEGVPSADLDNKTLGAAPVFFSSSRYLQTSQGGPFCAERAMRRTVHCGPRAPCLWHLQPCPLCVPDLWPPFWQL